MRRALRICLIASSRFPIAEPFAGGLEAHTHSLASELIRRGHEVTLFAAPGSDPGLGVTEIGVAPFSSSPAARADVGARPEEWMREHHAYLKLMLDLSRSPGRFDVVHNNSLHHLPVAMAEATGLPFVTTLHTPPVPWLESAAMLASPSLAYASVSRHTSRAWGHVVDSTVIRNGVDTNRWIPGPGGEAAIWFGRVVPEKAPDLAIRAAREAGMSIDLAGPSLDKGYFDAEIAPLLDDRTRYLGHLRHEQLMRAVGRACVSVVTPNWDEPYGLVAAESLACGTPVAAFARGGVPEILDERSGRLAAPGDVVGLGQAMIEAAQLSRGDARDRAVTSCSLERMVDDYELLYDTMIESEIAA
ncbi:glycosyltransferase [Agreia sp. VKM Ac-1783]|uniref:glycosyltransferase n=1 Tax=Agreia sp. VKM Ac-1783 TaxID=1938889 RepID=UPI000A2AD98F|nr:glycosyltransferase [Agreia sp. VKM Ac-1783]SMQ71823.1 Glycosyltransferase involved in cell wall bisynthesis [Agreia sp. VKM Ac-1783]